MNGRVLGQDFHAAEARIPQMSIGHFAAATRRIDSSWDPLFLIHLGEPGNKLEEPRQCLWR